MTLKRLFDILFSLAGLILLLPVFMTVSLLLKLIERGPVFFVQERVGKDFRLFRLYKFRTMYNDSSGNGCLITKEDDSRITRTGKFLRKSKIDELPQLWNVLKGDMSLVGPRPEVQKYVDLFRNEYEEILKVRPGLTDPASIAYIKEEKVLRDKADPEQYYIHFILPEKIKLAKDYIKNASLIYDLKIIFLTLFNLLYPGRTVQCIIAALTPYRKPIVVILQMAVFVASNYLAFFIRFDGKIPDSQAMLFLRYVTLLFVLRTIFLYCLGLNRGLWRYAGVRDLLNIVAATSLSSFFFLLIVRYILGDTYYPRSIYAIDWFLNIFLLGGLRLFRRLHEKQGERNVFRKRLIIIGAGSAAEMFLRDLESNSNYSYRVLGLVDDNIAKKGLMIRNIPILGTRKDLDAIVERERPDEFLIAIPSLSRFRFEEMLRDLRRFGLPIKTMPSLWSLLSGRGTSCTLQSIEPEDILFRPPAYNGGIDFQRFLRGKRILITGAGGSVGSELSKQIARCDPEKLILYERHEESLFKIDQHLRSRNYRGCAFAMPFIGDILDVERISAVMRKHRPHIVFHAAAYKHVPLMEDNVREAFRINVLGTKIVAEQSALHSVECFVLISTDKAVNPAGVMGMTKKIAEDVVRYISQDCAEGKTRFIIVRFGNVLESSGSVVPLFREQIIRGGPVTVTDPEATRYFMTISEAVTLILQAAAIGKSGDTLVLDMGEPVKVLDLAKRMIRLYGYEPGIDIEIRFTGLRPGEKLHEELFGREERLIRTGHEKIFEVRSNGRVGRDFLKSVRTLAEIARCGDEKDLKKALRELACYSETMLKDNRTMGAELEQRI